MRAVRLLDRDSTSPVTAVQFSPDGHHVAFCGRAQGITTDGRAGPVDGVVDVWDIQTGELLVKHEWRNGGYNTMQFSRDGRLCAAGGGGTIDRSGSGRVVLFDMHTALLI